MTGDTGGAPLAGAGGMGVGQKPVDLQPPAESAYTARLDM